METVLIIGLAAAALFLLSSGGPGAPPAPDGAPPALGPPTLPPQVPGAIYGAPPGYGAGTGSSGPTTEVRTGAGHF